MSSRDVPELSEGQLVDALAMLRMDATRAMGAGLRGQESPSDIVQSAFREFLELARSGVVPETLAPVERRGLLARLALRKIIDRVRYHGVRRRHRERSIQSRRDLPGQQSLDPARLHVLRERIEQLRTALAGLPADYREIIELAYYEHLPHAEIAARLGRTVDASKMLLSRAIARLARQLPSDG